MKKILFVVHEYYPNGSAITNCLKPIIDMMKENNIDVDILTRRQFKSSPKFEVLDEVKVFRVNDNFNIINNYINSLSSQKTNKLKLIIFKIFRKLFWTYKNIFMNSYDGWYNYVRMILKGKQILNKYKYDVIISCSYPFTSHKIASKIKGKSTIPWIAYQLDPYTFNSTLPGDKKSITKRMKEEIEILSCSDKIFLSVVNYEQNVETDLRILKDKYYVIDFALIKKITGQTVLKSNKEIIFAFAGTLYEKIREPFRMLDFFSKVNFAYKIELYYITEPVIENQLYNYKNKFGKKLNLHPNSAKKLCDSGLNAADIIINIGNKVSNQIPSKIFELISSGKPIVNFYYINDDTSKKVLENYPLKLNINLMSSNFDYSIFENFCKKSRGKQISFEEITKKYKSSEKVAIEFIEEVGRIYERRTNKK